MGMAPPPNNQSEIQSSIRSENVDLQESFNLPRKLPLTSQQTPPNLTREVEQDSEPSDAGDGDNSDNGDAPSDNDEQEGRLAQGGTMV